LGVPFKHPTVDLGYSYNVALQRLIIFELKTPYAEFLNEYEVPGHLDELCCAQAHEMK